MILLARVRIYQNLVSEYAKVFFAFVFAFGRTTMWKTVIGWFRMLIVADWSRRAFIMRFSLGPVSRSTETVEDGQKHASGFRRKPANTNGSRALI